MREETVTIILMNWLKREQWKILSFDYPGSGTGIRFHKNGTHDKNKDTIIPDIIAVKGNTALFFENKERFHLKDFEKQYSNIREQLFSNDVSRLLEQYTIERYFWGIGLPDDQYTRNVTKHEWMVDFVVTVESEELIHVRKGLPED